jgi:predicted dehydrogenase
MKPGKLLNRRQFGRTLAISVGGITAAPAFLRGQNLNNKLNIAVIGTGGRGGSNLASVASENIVALCDVNAHNLNAAAAKFTAARKYSDFRKVFENAKSFDAVVVSTCEHTHAFATMLALKSGKHVYCEKPLTHNIWEARQIRLAAEKAKVATQMGIQIHATDNYRKVVELVQSGAIGPVKEAHVWVSRAWGWQSQEDAKRHGDIVWVTERPTQTDPVPPGLDWDLWLGPALERPFNSAYFPGPKWYRWWDFGNGTMSDLGSHWNDLPFWALKLKYPLTVEASGPPAHPEIAPASMSATYEYASREGMPAVKLVWHQGEDKPEIWKSGGIPKWDSGCLFIGSQGRMLLADYNKFLLLPEKEFVDFQRPEPTIPRVKGHHEEWIEACKTGGSPSANFEYAGWLTEANHLGNVAFRVGKKLEWDPKKLRAKNTSEADRFIHRQYRKGWKLA